MLQRKFSLLCCVLMLSSTALADGLTLVSREGRQAEYSGTVSLSGRFERRQDAETLDWRGDRVCFYPDAAGVKQLPSNSNRTVWFCFSNHRAATQLLSLAPTPPTGSCGVTGTATVAISRYTAEGGTAEVFDQAWLDKVLQQGPTSPLRCN